MMQITANAAWLASPRLWCHRGQRREEGVGGCAGSAFSQSGAVHVVALPDHGFVGVGGVPDFRHE